MANPKRGAVIGKFRIRNRNASILTRFVNIETLAYQCMNQAGRYFFFKLCTIPGTNYVIRRSIIQEIGGWDPKALSEDAEETQAESEENDFSRPPEHGHSPYAKDFAYGQDVVFSGAYDTNRFYFQIPDYWQVEYAYARIQLTVSQLIGDGPASLTFALGDSPICSVELGGGAKERVLYVPIPVEQLKTGFNSFPGLAPPAAGGGRHMGPV